MSGEANEKREYRWVWTDKDGRRHLSEPYPTFEEAAWRACLYPRTANVVEFVNGKKRDVFVVLGL